LRSWPRWWSRDWFRRYVLSQGLPAAFWAAQVYRDGDLFELTGSTPLELDIVVSRDIRR
jgi:hypothetical protein